MFSERRPKPKRRRRHVLYVSACGGLFLLMGIIGLAVGIPVGITQSRSSDLEMQILVSQSLVQISNTEIAISVTLKNNDPSIDLNVTTVFNSLINGSMTCVPTIPATIFSGGGLLMCYDIYVIEPMNDMLVSVTNINDEYILTNEIQVIVFPDEICNHTATLYASLVRDTAERQAAPAVSADGSCIAVADRSDYVTRIQVYMLDITGTSWIQKGQPTLPLPPGFSIPPLDGSIVQQESTISISDDGNTVAGVLIGVFDGIKREFAIVYDIIGGSTWTIRGSVIFTNSIENTAVEQYHRNYVSLSGDGNSLAFSHASDIFNSIVNLTAEVYDWNGLDWEKRGNSQILDSRFYGVTGFFVEPLDIKLSADKNHFIVGYYDLRNSVGILNQVIFKVFEWNGIDWQQKGQNVTTLYQISGTAQRDVGLDISPTGDIAFMLDVYDWNEALNQWISRPEIPNGFPATHEPVLAMSQDGNFVISTPNAVQAQIDEWKPLQNEWVNCQNISLTAFPSGYVLYRFSRDGMHFITYDISSTVSHPNFGPAVLSAYNFLN